MEQLKKLEVEENVLTLESGDDVYDMQEKMADAVRQEHLQKAAMKMKEKFNESNTAQSPVQTSADNSNFILLFLHHKSLFHFHVIRHCLLCADDADSSGFEAVENINNNHEKSGSLTIYITDILLHNFE